MSLDDCREDCFRLNVPSLFGDPAFIAWLNTPGKRMATWHGAGEPSGEMSDVFVTYDSGEGSDAFEMPEHCWLRLYEFLKRHGYAIGYCVLWLTNLPSDPDTLETP